MVSSLRNFYPNAWEFPRFTQGMIAGPRTQQFLMRKIKPAHIRVFRIALQCIKYWATRRCIYGKPMGYLNGSTWTFLLLRTYMDTYDDKLTVYRLLRSFFTQWSQWPWPEPAMLTKNIPGFNGESLSYKEIVSLFHRHTSSSRCQR